MPMERSGPIARRFALDEERDSLYRRMVDQERRELRFEREERALREVERSFLGLMDSAVFLFLIVDLEGNILACNRCVEKFWGVDPRGADSTLLRSLCAPDSAGELEGLLLQASRGKVRSRLVLSRPDGSRVWVESELMPLTFRGDAAVQIVGVDVTEKVVGVSPRETEGWDRVLDSCPGLLCCVLDDDGRLLYATRGYRAVAQRFLGHACELGSPYPPEANSVDRSLHEILSSALLGGTNGIELMEKHAEGVRAWDVTASPLLSSQGKAVGAVLRMAPLAAASAAEAPAPPPKEAETPRIAFPGPELLDAVSDMLAVVSRQGNCLAANERFFAALSLDPAVLLGKPLTELPLADDPLNADFPGRLGELLRAGGGALEFRVSTSQGELLWLDVRGRPVQWGGADAVLLTCTDVTLLRRTQEQLRRVAVTDRTTGLLNRQGMERVLVTELERAARYRGSLCLLFMDIDDFRRLNETRGYAASDRALKTLMAALKNILRPTDFLGRWGGDEFMVLTPQPAAAARQLADALRDTARNGVFDRENAISLSVGVAEFSREMDVSAFVGAAYDAMTAAKKDGGDRTVLAGGSETNAEERTD